VSHRVIADHLRASSFLIADGVLPSNEGRGYVLRRIMRRAMRHAHILGARDPLMWRLVPALVRQMGDAYPELHRANALIAETLKFEEERFKQTLDRGLRLLDEATGTLPEGGKLAGEVAFKLYDTFGFPLDLTQDVLRGRGLGVDTEGFNAAMEKQREDARKAWAGSGEAATEAVWFDLRERLGATEFLGYAETAAEGQVKALLLDGKEVARAETGAEVAIIVNQTPFYGESGGQVGDTGAMFTAEGAEIAIRDTQKKVGDLFVHSGTVTRGALAVGDAVEMRVDAQRRDATRRHHSATHLLHAALRRHLGTHVAQRGSLVSPDRLRFDISHPKPITADEVAAIEAEVNERIRMDSAVATRLMPIKQAIDTGAMALFGEKYGDEVRVVTMGGPEAPGANREYSIELCGGTHVGRTGEIGAMVVTGESAVGAGLRRIEALTGEAAERFVSERLRIVDRAAQALRTTPDLIVERIESLTEERRRLERELSDMRKRLAAAGPASGPGDRTVGGMRFDARVLDGVPPRELKGMADELKSQLGSGVVALVATNDGKGSIVVAVTPDLTERVSAVDLVRVGAEAMGGKGGGGRPDMAQAGGPDGGLAAEAVSAIERAVAAAGA
jgi:alanyl-tRNA synthetase